jgi:alkylation response protein AidB-like acyl-CoA dehydrogenase
MAADAIIVPAFTNGRAGTDGSGSVTATLVDDVARLSGCLDVVSAAGEADGLLVEASAAGRTGLYQVETDAPGLTISPVETVDGRAYGRVDLNATPARAVTDPDESQEVADTHYTLALVAAAAEMLGVMTAAHEATLAYLKERHQFGRPIGSFQALQHRAVDDYAAVCSTRALLFQLCAQGEAIPPAMASALKAFASKSCLSVTKSAIQMHGAIGFTDEHDIGLYLKRAMWLSAYLGNETMHVRRFAEL